MTDSNTANKTRQHAHAQTGKKAQLKPHEIEFARIAYHITQTKQKPETRGDVGPLSQHLAALIDAVDAGNVDAVFKAISAANPRIASMIALLREQQDQESTDTPKKKTLVNFAELRKRPRPAWVIEGFIYENTIIELYAEAGCYKSFLAFDWSARIATGTAWLNHIPVLKQGMIVYIAAEGADGYISRGDAWCTHNKVSFDDLARNFYFWPETLPLTNNAEIDRFIQEVADTIKETEQTPRLVVIDTLLRCSGGENINSPDVMSSIFNGAAYIKDTLKVPNVLIVHHAGKNAQLGGMGSVVLKNNCDCIYFMQKDSSMPGQVILRAEKMKDKPELQLYLRSEKVYYTEFMCEDESSLVLVEGEKPEKEERKVPDSQQALLDILDEHKEIAYKEWFDLWHVEGTKGRSKTNFNKIRDRMLEDHTIEKHNGKYRRYIAPKTEQEELTEDIDQEEDQDE